MTIRKIKNRFKIITNEISQLVEDKYVFEKYKEYIKNSKDIDKQSRFLFWLTKNYQNSSLINVWKQIDERNDVESLVNLLEDIKKLKNSFSKFLIKISKNEINKDIREIKRAICGARFGKKRQSVESLAKYRHKRGAHFANDKKKVIVPVEKLFSAIDLLEKMTIKYNLLLNKFGMDTLLSDIDNYLEFDKVFKK